MVALPMAAFGLAFVDYRESGKDARNFQSSLKAYTQYTVQIILSQGMSNLEIKIKIAHNNLSSEKGGNYISGSKWKLRWAVGAWLLSAFVLITAYSSVLFSFILAPQFKPLIRNIQELAERNDVSPVFVKGSAAERLVMVIYIYTIKTLQYNLPSRT